MMDLLANLGLGASVAFAGQNILLCFLGCLIGTLIGVLPGLGPIATISILLPVTFGLDATGALIMLAGIYYGAQYGGSTTAILMRIPGEANSIVTVIDGHAMAQQGRAGIALGIAAIGSFIAGTIATVFIGAIGAPLASVAIRFGAADYFSLMVMGLVFAVILAHGSVLKALIMVFLGLLLSTVGTDLAMSGMQRMTFGFDFLYDGIDFSLLAMGLFGIGEILKNLDSRAEKVEITATIGRLLPNWSDFKQSFGAILRGTGIGAALGILPGSGAVLSPFASYAIEKRVSKHPERFGNGAIEGVAGPESANNAAAQTSFIPLLTLGLPASAVMALMVGAMTIQGINPGPQVMTTRPDLFWGMIVSMWVANVMLLIINLPLIRIWVSFLKVPYRLLFPAILVMCSIGVYSLSNSTSEVILCALIGLVGYLLFKFRFEPAPLLLGFVLGGMIEENLRRALIIARGDVTVFVREPISLVLLLATVALLVTVAMPKLRSRREQVFSEAEE